MARTLAALAILVAAALPALAEGLPPTPQGDAGIASKYPLDAGIGKDPRVIFFEDFESESWKDKWYQHNVRWRVNEVEAVKGEGMSFGGAASAKLVVGAGKLYGSTLGSGKHPPGWDTMHLRWYVKFSDNYRGGKLGTTTALDEKTWVPGASGVAPTGTDKANAMVCIQPKGLVEMYYYNLDQRGPWGSGGKPNVGAAPALPNGRWHCIEVQGTMNVPGEKNSLMKLWVNGELARPRASSGTPGASSSGRTRTLPRSSSRSSTTSSWPRST
jgi:hypothetical protein